MPSVSTPTTVSEKTGFLGERADRVAHVAQLSRASASTHHGIQTRRAASVVSVTLPKSFSAA